MSCTIHHQVVRVRRLTKRWRNLRQAVTMALRKPVFLHHCSQWLTGVISFFHSRELSFDHLKLCCEHQVQRKFLLPILSQNFFGLSYIFQIKWLTCIVKHWFFVSSVSVPAFCAIHILLNSPRMGNVFSQLIIIWLIVKLFWLRIKDLRILYNWLIQLIWW